MYILLACLLMTGVRAATTFSQPVAIDGDDLDLGTGTLDIAQLLVSSTVTVHLLCNMVVNGAAPTGVCTFSGSGIFIGTYNDNVRVAAAGKYWNSPTYEAVSVAYLQQTNAATGSIAVSNTAMTASFAGNGASFRVVRIVL